MFPKDSKMALTKRNSFVFVSWCNFLLVCSSTCISKLCSSLLEGLKGKVKEKIKSHSSILAVDGSHLSCPSLALFPGGWEGREINTLMLLGLSDAEDILPKYIFKEGKAQRTSHFTNPQTLSFLANSLRGWGGLKARGVSSHFSTKI